jgi:AraC family transcriptional regulator
MSERSDYRRPLAAFRTPDAPALSIRKFSKSTLALTEITGPANHGMTASIPSDDAFLVQLRLRECAQCDYFYEGRHIDGVDRRAGMIQLHDLRRDPTVDLRDPFHVMHFYLPRRVLNAIAEEAGAPTVDTLALQPGASADDAIARNLFLSLQPSLERPDQANALFVDHVASALCAHIAHAYGGVRNVRTLPRGGLAPWQERRAKELLHSDLSGEFPLGRLALECGLSIRHFTRAFRQSVGVAPHRYLLKIRIVRAQELLTDPRLSLLDIALACGFADQSHFTRIFRASMDMSPGAWRRQQSQLAKSGQYKKSS